MIDDEDHLVFKVRDAGFLHGRAGIFENLAGFVGNQVIADIQLVFKIKIKSSLCHACIVYNIRNRSFRKTMFYKQRKCRDVYKRQLEYYEMCSRFYRGSGREFKPFLKKKAEKN